MKTPQPELASEAAIYADGTEYSAEYLAESYRSYCRNIENADGEPDDFQRWIEVDFPSCCK